MPIPCWRQVGPIAAARFVSEPANAVRAGYFRLRLDSPDPRARRVERLAAWRCRTFGLPYGDQGLLMARAFYRRLGGFHPLPLMEDVELVRRIGSTEPGRARDRRRHLGTALRKGRLAAPSDAKPRLPCPVLRRRAGAHHPPPLWAMTRHLVIFARVPQAGRTKRRLADEIGVTAAARFYRTILSRQIRRLTSDRRWTVWLFVTPDDSLGPSGMARHSATKGEPPGIRQSRAAHDAAVPRPATGAGGAGRQRHSGDAPLAHRTRLPPARTP